MCPEEKNISMSYQGCEMAVKWYFKKIQKKPPEVQKQSPEVFCKERCFATSHENTCVGIFSIKWQPFSRQVFLK